MSDNIFDLIIIGGGPGGYVAAIRGAQLGMSVAVIEKRDTLGGVCLNEGCIPSKALLDSSEHFAMARDKFAGHGIMIDPPRLDLARMMARKDDVVKKNTDGIAYLFKKNGLTFIQGSGRIGAADGEFRSVEVTMPGHNKPESFKGKRILLATGSRAVELPGLKFDGKKIVSAREALAFTAVPEHLLVVGAGYIGLELGSVWLRLGAKVTVVEMLDKPLPTMDGQIADTLVRSLKKQGMQFLFSTRVNSAVNEGAGLKVALSGISGEQELFCDRILVAVGRRPLTEDLGLKEADIVPDSTGRISVNENYQTSAAGIYAIGDLISGPMLAHKASEEGVVCVERLHGEGSTVEYEYLPGVCYTWPEAASAGKTEEQLKAEGVAYSVGRFNFLANGRARCMDETDGFVKILAQLQTGRILGVHIVGPRASDLIAEAVTAMTFGATAEDIAMTFHAHPTLAETIKEAALDVAKRAIHG